MPWLTFIQSTMPALLDLLGDLFTKHRGNADEAKREIKRIREHATTWTDARDAMQAELAAQQRKAGGEP